MDKTIILVGNDVIGSGEVTAYWADSKVPSPFGIKFIRKEKTKIVSQGSFNLSRSEAKNLALFILKRL